MRLDEIAKIGEIFEIEVGQLRVHTKLQDFLDGREFAVLQPTIKGAPLRSFDQKFMFSFFKPEGVFVFEAEMVESYIKDDIRLCRFRQTTEIKKIQRRQYYRLPIVLDVVIADVTDSENPKQYKAKTVTLSENSVDLTCFTLLAEDTPVTVRIQVSARETIPMHGKVIKGMEPAKKTEPYGMVILFAETARFRPRLSRYIFTQQIMARNKQKTDQL
jgi:c-di-GMP-binding flagellar brake protein YcgR